MYIKTLLGAVLGLTAQASARKYYSSATSASSSMAMATGSASGYHNMTGSGNYSSSEITKQFPAPFPDNVGPADQAKIEAAALGQIPQGNAPPPPAGQDSIISLGLIAFNELFEVAFFTELIQNITKGVEGYTDIPNKEEVLRVLKVVQAQEELHELNANGGFQKLGNQGPIEPCLYDFPVNNFTDAIALASKFTDVVLATLPDIQTVFAQQHDVGLIRGVGSVIGQEGEQNGFYHKLLNQVPNQLPFLTGGARNFAFNAILQNFVVAGSCPNIHLLIASENGKGVGLRTINTLEVLTEADAFSIDKDIVAEFSAVEGNAGLPKTNNFLAQPQANTGFFLTYINQQNSPFSVAAHVITGTDAGPLKFRAEFPGKTYDLNGLTIAAVTASNFTGQQASPDDVAGLALFGPALIEVNQKLDY